MIPPIRFKNIASLFFRLASMGVVTCTVFSPLATNAQSNSTWLGSVDNEWGNAGNWTNGVPSSSGTAFFRNPGSDIEVYFSSPTTVSGIVLSNTTGKIVFGGEAITFDEASGRMVTSTSSGVSADEIVFNNHVVLAGTSFDLGLSTSAHSFSRVVFNGNILASIPNARLAINSLGVTVLNGSSAVHATQWRNTGDIVVGNERALGISMINTSGQGMLSLKTDLILEGHNSYSWLNQNDVTVKLRIESDEPSSEDRTFVMGNKLQGGGAFEWVDNVNSTGKLILELRYSGGNAQTVDLLMNENGVVRFSTTGNNGNYWGNIQGAGRVEKINTGVITIHGTNNTYSGGTYIYAGTLKMGAEGVLPETGPVFVSGGIFDLNGRSITTGSVTLTSGSINNGTLLGSGYRVEKGTVNAALSGSGGLTKATGETVLLTAANSYTGQTVIDGGMLRLTGTGSIAASSEIRVAAGATFSVASITNSDYTFGAHQTLSGAGTVEANAKHLLVEGTIAPGDNGAGTLTIALYTGYHLTLGADSKFVFDLGSTSDRVLVTSGILNIGDGTLGFDDFTFVLGEGVTEGSYTLFQTSKAIEGSLGITSGMIGGYNANLEIVGTNLVVTLSIPEPGTLVYLLGAAGLAVLFRRRNH